MKWERSCAVLPMLVLLPLLYGLPAGRCEAAEGYRITAEELQQWQAELNLQQELLKTLRKSSEKQRQELTELQSELKQSKERLTATQASLISSEQALNDANQSLMEYAAEQKRTRLRIKRQRNLAYTLLAGIIGYKIYHKTH